jgi:hypothetical protein
MAHNWQVIKSPKWFDNENNWIDPVEKKNILKATEHPGNVYRLMRWTRRGIMRIRHHLLDDDRAAGYIINCDSLPQICVSVNALVRILGKMFRHGSGGMRMSNPILLDPKHIVLWAKQQMEVILADWSHKEEFYPDSIWFGILGYEQIREIVEATILLMKHFRIWAVPYTKEEGNSF